VHQRLLTNRWCKDRVTQSAYLKEVSPVPEHPICVRCEVPIDKDKDDYVVINKHLVEYDDKWLYAHVACQHERARGDG
jgi:hypothetical protein